MTWDLDRSNEPRSCGHGSDLKQFTAVNDRLALLIIAGDYLFAIAVAAAAIVAQSWLATLAAIVLIAGRQVAFLNLVHAAAHYSLFSTRKANNRTDALIGYPILDSVQPYRSYHLQHHRDVARKSPDRFDYLHDKLPGPDAGAWRRLMIVVIKPLCGFAGFGFVHSTIDACRENPTFASKLAGYWGVVVELCGGRAISAIS